MTTKVTAKGQVTLPKSVRDALGIKPGDEVEVFVTPTGAHIEKPRATSEYEARLRALAKRRLIRGGMTTDEFMEFSRGETASFRRRKK
jgi:AbrB family looped-hinge helix DNA binding protein